MGVALHLRPWLVALAFVLAWPAGAIAETVDWQRGLLISSAAAVGDLRSPSRAMARIKAERQARKRAREKLLLAARQIQKAGGGDYSEDVEAIALAAQSLPVLQTDFGTDGSVVVKMALPLDLLRRVAHGPDALRVGLSGAKAEPSPLVVDARSVGITPAIGYALFDGSSEYRGPTVFYSDAKQLKQRFAGVQDTAFIPVKKVQGSRLQIPPHALKLSTEGMPLVVILWSEKIK